MSFSQKIKEEIVLNDFTVEEEKAILSSMIKIIGTLSINSNGLSLLLRTENAKIASKLHKMLKELYDPVIEFKVSRKMKLKKNNVYYLQVSKAKEILDDLNLYDTIVSNEVPSVEFRNDESVRAYLVGVFLSTGSVNDPSTSNYHLEMRVTSYEYATFICALMNQYELSAKIIQRRNQYVVYLKSAEKIGDFIRALGAGESAMEFEITRIDRSMYNTVNRVNNCDIANEVKIIKAAQSQMEDIAVIFEKVGLELLDPKTQIVAKLRIDHPEASLNELIEAYEEETGQTISKASLHRRFAKIKTEADKIRKLENND